MTLRPQPNSALLGVLAIVAANSLWGLSFLLGKIALDALPASQVILLRFGLASLLLAPLLPSLRHNWRMADLPHFVLSAVLMVPVMMLTQFSGLERTSATHAALIIGMIPVLMAVASVVFDAERVGKSIWIAAVFSTIGVAGMVVGSGGSGGGASIAGDLLVLGSAVSAVLWTVVTRRLLRRYPSLGVTAACVLLGTLAQAPLTVAMDGLPSLNIPMGPLLAIIGLGVGCTAITYGLWNWGLNHVSTARAGVLVNLEPLVGAVGGIYILNETAGPSVWFGGILILGAAVTAAIASPEAAEQSGADAGALPPEEHYSSATSNAAP